MTMKWAWDSNQVITEYYVEHWEIMETHWWTKPIPWNNSNIIFFSRKEYQQLYVIPRRPW